MLSDVTTPERVDQVSTQINKKKNIGSCVPFDICLLLVLNDGNVNDDFFCYYYFLVVWSYFTTIKNLSTKILCRKKTPCDAKTVLNVYLKR